MGGIKFIPASPAPSGVTNANQGLRVNAGFVQLGDPVGDPVTNPMVRRYIQIEEGGDSSQLVFQGPSLQGIYLNDNSQWVIYATAGQCGVDFVDGVTTLNMRFGQDGERLTIGNIFDIGFLPATPTIGIVPAPPVFIVGDVSLRRFSILVTNGSHNLAARLPSIDIHQDQQNEPTVSVTLDGGSEAGTTRNFFACNSVPGGSLEVSASGGEDIIFPGVASQVSWILTGQDGFLLLEKTVSGWYVIGSAGTWV